MRDQADVVEVFPRREIGDVGDLGVEIDVLAEKMRAVAVAGERRRINFVAARFEQVSDAAPAPAAVISAVHEHESLAHVLLRYRLRRYECRHTEARRAQRRAARDRMDRHRFLLGFGTLGFLRNRDHIYFDQHARPCELIDIEEGMYGLWSSGERFGAALAGFGQITNIGD